MKKTPRKLSLSRDTLARLEGADLRPVAGGSNSDCDSLCDMITCPQDCGGIEGR